MLNFFWLFVYLGMLSLNIPPDCWTTVRSDQNCFGQNEVSFFAWPKLQRSVNYSSSISQSLFQLNFQARIEREKKIFSWIAFLVQLSLSFSFSAAFLFTTIEIALFSKMVIFDFKEEKNSLSKIDLFCNVFEKQKITKNFW